MIGTSLGLFLAPMELEGRLFNYLNNLTGLNCITKGMRRQEKPRKLMSSPIQPSPS